MKLTTKNLEIMVKAGARRKELLALFEVNLTQFLKFLREECDVASYAQLVDTYIEREEKPKPKFEKFVILSGEIIDWIHSSIQRQYAVGDIVQGIAGNAYSANKTIEGIYAAQYNDNTLKVPLVPKAEGFTGNTNVVFEIPKAWRELIFDVAVVPANAIAITFDGV